MKNHKLILFLCWSSILFSSCENFLSEKSDGSLATISSVKDLQALLDNTSQMNMNYVSAIGEIASDNIFFPDQYYNAISSEPIRAVYIWGRIPLANTYWTTYQGILNANIVIHHADKIEMTSAQRNELLGSALFHRAFRYLDVAQIYAKAYSVGSAHSELGPVTKITPDVNELSFRPSLQDTYDMIIHDLNQAIPLLSVGVQPYATRPSKSSAMALLARTYLVMGKYEEALAYAEASLAIHDELLDYNQIRSTAKYPFDLFNKEILFQSTHSVGSVTREAVARIDSNFYRSYEEHDLRKRLFFTKQNDGYMAFTGDYTKSSADARFNGLTTAETWLTLAECYIRIGKIEDALNTINHFRKHRYETASYTDVDVDNKEELLILVLQERRKELIMRGVRWMDLRRLEPTYMPTEEIKRKIDDVIIEKSYEELKNVAFLIPQDVINRSSVAQN